MSYDIVKNGIALMVKGRGFSESSKPFDFENAPANELGNSFILNALSGLMGEDSETLVDRFFDYQTWEIQIAYSKNENNDLVVKDTLHRDKDDIIKYIDKPANWTGIARIVKYSSWELQDFPNYYVLVIRLDVIDTYIYS